MNIAILLCSVILTADSPAPVEARVLYGTASEGNQRNDIEPWICQAAAKFGSPLVLPHTVWVVLAGDQRLDASRDGGFVIHGKVLERRRKVTLKPGERRVVN